MTQILMVRHGQSEWNAQGRWQGQADPPLTTLGLRQASAAGEYLRAWPAFDGLASSTLDRAATTATLIGEQIGVAEDAIYRCTDLVERNAGEWSGLTRADIERSYPGYLAEGKYPPGYEYDDALIVRIRRGLLDVVENVPGDRIMVVAHGGIVYCLEASCGLAFQHLSNLGSRWLSVSETGEITLGERVRLLVDFDGETTPSEI